jgi:hypothetical protein
VAARSAVRVVRHGARTVGNPAVAPSAGREKPGASAGANPRGAHLVEPALFAAGPTIDGIDAQLDARLSARRRPTGAEGSACAEGANLTNRAYSAARAAVCWIAIGIDATRAALRGGRPSAARAA